MTTHTNCTHPATKAGRAACRAGKEVRTDAHRPSVFQPEDYDFSHTGTYSTDEFLADVRRDAARMYQLRVAEGYRADFEAGRCSHCGTAIIHYAIMLHLPSKTMIEIGETCLNGRFEMANASFDSWRKMRVGKAAREAKKTKLSAFIDANPTAQTILDYAGDNDFVRDLQDKLTRYAELSEKQLDAAARAITRDIDRQAARAAREAMTASLAPLTPGRRVITGKIVSTKWVDSHFGYGASGSLKMLVEDAEGYRYYGTCPSAIDSPAPGVDVTITATIQPSDDDASFAFFKRPSVKG